MLVGRRLCQSKARRIGMEVAGANQQVRPVATDHLQRYHRCGIDWLIFW